MKRVYWLTVLLLPVLFLALMGAIDRAPQVDAQLVRSGLWGIESQSERMPEFEPSAAVSLELPDGNLRTTDGEASGAWYRYNFENPATTQPTWAVLITEARGNFAVYVNDTLAGQSAPMVRPYAEVRFPLYFEFPTALLHAGNNTLTIRAVSERNGSWLWPFYLGPAEVLAPVFQRVHFIRVQLVAATAIALGVISVLLLGLFLIRPRDIENGWFAAATSCWALYNWLIIEPRVLVPATGVWFSLPVLLLGWFTIFSACFVSHLPGCLPTPRLLKRVALPFAAACSILLIWHEQSSYLPSDVSYSLWLPFILLVSLYTLWQLLRAVLLNPSFETRLWLLAAVLTVVVGVRDYVWDLTTFAGTFHYLSYTVSLVLIVLSLTFLARVSRALTVAETLNRELEGRVAAKGAELAQKYEQLQVLERQRAIGAERERITADMHDGIGGQLVHALAVVEGSPAMQPLEPVLRGALDDLRLIIDSTDQMEGDLLVVLSNFRARNERRVQAGGLKFLWQVSELPALPDFGPHKMLQVLRILQEALTNVLKHARATQVTVRTDSVTDASGTTIVVDVIDDGTGFVEGGSAGRGLGNMRRRAQDIGGAVEFTGSPQGSQLRLLIPVR